jgi:hypothetical protein
MEKMKYKNAAAPGYLGLVVRKVNEGIRYIYFAKPGFTGLCPTSRNSNV